MITNVSIVIVITFAVIIAIIFIAIILTHGSHIRIRLQKKCLHGQAMKGKLWT